MGEALPRGLSLERLLRLDVARAGAAVRRPQAGPAFAVIVPGLALLGILRAAGGAAAPEPLTPGSAVGLGVLTAAPVAFLAFGVLFGGADRVFLRRLGASGGEFFAERSLRLLLLAVLPPLLLLVPFAAGGVPLGPPLAVGLAGALGAWGGSCLAFSLSARSTAGVAGAHPSALWGVGMWDSELARVGPMVYAPVIPLLAGSFAATWVGMAAGGGWVRLAILAAGSLGLALAGMRLFPPAYPRLVPWLQEASFEPTPSGRTDTLRVGRGATRLLPRRAASVWARDAVLAGRRFAWAGRAVWPALLVSVIALARWGEQPAARWWAVAVVVATLLVQGAAILGIGRIEASGRRWIDRALGIRWHHRFLGRWAWGWGLSLWLLIPFALAWSWWTDQPGAPLWLAAGLATSGIAAATSVLLAGWR